VSAQVECACAGTGTGGAIDPILLQREALDEMLGSALMPESL